ncbi:MAG: hypothetical protein EBY40_09985 [Marivivens sp.]|nr:hypothetical protein [Marivivens sp.]
MTYELFPEAHGAILRGKLETTYSTDPTIADADVYRAPVEASFDSFKRSAISRQTQAAFISGVKASPASAMGEYSIEAILDHQALTASTDIATYTDVPQADVWLRAGGFQASYDSSADYSGIKPDSIVLAGGSNDRILTYTYKPRSTSIQRTSARWEYTEIDESNEGLKHVLAGARHGWTLNMPGGEHWTLSCEGKSLPAVPTRVSSPTVNSTFDDNDAIVGLGGNYALTKFLTTADTFGKASETADASTMEAFVYNMSLSSNLEVQEIIAPNGDYGVAQVRYVAGVPQLKCTIDQVMWSEDWDLYSFMNNANGIRVSTTCPLPGSTTDFVVFSFTGQIVDIVRGSDNGYRNVELTLDYLYPENSDDGGLTPAAGITFKYVTIV